MHIQVTDYLPHRPPMLLVDNVQSFTKGQMLTAIYTPQANNPIFAGHFPNQPIWPGVLIVEGLAQSAALLVGLTEELPAARATYLFRQIEQLEFKAPVLPNQCLTYHVQLTRAKLGFYSFQVSANVQEQVVAQGSLTAKLIVKNSTT